MNGLDRHLLLQLCKVAGSEPRIDADRLIAACDLRDGSHVELTLKIEETLYTIPEFAIDLEQYPALRGLPHVGHTGAICTFDTTFSQLDPRNPERGVAAVLKRAIRVLNDGIDGSNHEDYAKELDAYWLMESEGIGYLCDSFSFDAGTLYCAFARRKGSKVPCFASNEQTAIAFARRLGDHSIHAPKAVPCLHLSLSQPLSFPLPATCVEWDREIRRSGSCVLKIYRNFLCSCKKKAAFVILSVPSESGRLMVGLSQSATPHLRGFVTPSKRHALALQMPSYRDEKVLKYRLENISQDRLFSRGGNGSALDGAYAIIGCGSLGSHLAKILSDAGASRFLIIDNDTVEVENIARHVCGFDYIGQNKSQAIKALLEKSNPNLECSSITTDANKVLDNSPEVFDDYQALFVTTADIPVEYHCVRALLDGKINGPVIIMWIESFAMAAHAIVLNSPQDVYQDFFDQDLTFLHPVIENANEYLMREAGCQSTYMPYSGLDVQAFLLDFLRLWNNKLRKDRWNYHFVWVGRLSSAGDVGMKVATAYTEMKDYAHYIERID